MKLPSEEPEFEDAIEVLEPTLKFMGIPPDSFKANVYERQTKVVVQVFPRSFGLHCC